jgi:predicted RecA/RadA family phage recombinase
MAEALFIQDECDPDYTPGTATVAGTIILHSSGKAAVILAGLAAGEQGAAIREGIFDVLSASATLFDDGESVWWDDTNNLAVKAGAATATFRVGTAVRAKVNGETVVRLSLNEVDRDAVSLTTLADSAAVTNVTAETIVGTYSIPANTLKAGMVLEFLASILASATNSTDTFRGRVRIGGVSGTVVADTTAIDLANGDQGVMHGQITVRAAGASGSIAASSQSVLKTTANPVAIGATTLDTTVAQTLVVTIQESVASAGNSAVCPQFNVTAR